MDLPPPVNPNQAPPTPEATPVLRQGTEVNPEFLPQVAADQPQPPAPVAQDHVAPAQQAAPSTADGNAAQPKANPITATPHPELAEDVDLIEKEWVDKAKAIVNHTKDDPHRQNSEINKMKADYIKKRYNKDIQVSE